MSVAEEPNAQRVHGDTLPIRKPTNTEELRALVKRAVAALRRLQNAESRKQTRIDYYQQKIDDLKAGKLKDRDKELGIIRKIMPRVYDYIEANRYELTNRDRRKSVAFPTGTFNWQLVQYTSIPDVDAFFREVRGLRLAKKFIRVKEEPNRTALLETKNAEKTQLLSTASVVDEVRPQLRVPGLTLRIERVRKKETEDEYEWDVVDPGQRTQ